MSNKIFIKTMGHLSVERDGEEIKLPSSRKTRALLAYLAVTARPHRRERLCELFWDVPDDPRGALRWSLSKLRGVLNTEGTERIVADRERVQIDTSDVSVDFVIIRKRLFDDPPLMPPQELRDMAATLGNALLDGLGYGSQDAFASWLVAEREDVNLLKLNVLRRLALHPEISVTEAVSWARRWTEADPFGSKPAETYVSLLRQSGQNAEATQFIDAYTTELRKAGLEVTTDFDACPDSQSNNEPKAAPNRTLLLNQNIGFCRTDDNVRIAYATVGEGPSIVKAANWLNHLELDWDSPIWGDTFRACANGRTFIRYDERGNGLSDWDVDDISQRAFVSDLETVVDALNLKKFPLLGISQGCAVSIEYAVRHPERVSALILISGYASGWRIGATEEEQERREAVMTLTKHGWGTNNPAYRHIFSQTFMPDAKPDELDWFDEFQRQTTSPENAVRFQQAFGNIDVRELLPQVKVPTIVFHSKDDQRISLAQGREVAAGIPGARFVPLESKNHILLGHEPAWTTFFDETNRFLAEHGI